MTTATPSRQHHNRRGTVARPENLRDACLDEAFAIIRDEGLEKLSLREVARRLGVSHQAPYKHFPSRDHILAEVIARCFDDFAAHLKSAPRPGPVEADMHQLGLAYFDYARRFPLQYRLMFNTPLPDKGDHPGMMASARYAYAVLCEQLSRMPLRPIADPLLAHSIPAEALFVWSAIHGLASILQSDALDTLGLSREDQETAIARCLARISMAMHPDC